MKTYKTYQEAKIASPEYAIFERDGVFGTDKAMVNYFEMHTCNYKECKPSDYCVTSEEFLKDGYAFVAGDFIFSSISQEVYEVDEIDCIDWNTPSEYDKVRYVLRASAIDRHEITEWNGEGLPPVGDECEMIFDGKVKLITPLYFTDFVDGLVLFYHSSNSMPHCDDTYDWCLVENCIFRKLETLEAKKERERLEAAYDLYCHVQSTQNQAAATFELFTKVQGIMTLHRERYLTIVDKTNYRKGE